MFDLIILSNPRRHTYNQATRASLGDLEPGGCFKVVHESYQPPRSNYI